MLIGHAIFPADRFAEGTPPSGAFDDEGRRRAQPQFEAQPIQGLSALQRGPEAAQWWALSDNGFGASANSSDYRTAIYRFALEPRMRPRDPRPAGAERVRLVERIALRDPARHFPWRLVEESLAERPLTGADVDPESFVHAFEGHDGFWIGDEVGPWLLHVDSSGALREAPIELRVDGEPVRSINHPLVRAGRAPATIRASKGIEGLAPGPAPGTLVALLEGTLPNDSAGTLRIVEFDVARRAWTGRSWRYVLEDPAHAIGELTALGDRRYLVIERDERHGPAARFKRIYEIDLAAEPAATLAKTLRVDLLDIADPQRLASTDGRYAFPYWTTESVAVVDERTLLVVNDNNYPATGGRAAGIRDDTEWIWVRLPVRLMTRPSR